MRSSTIMAIALILGAIAAFFVARMLGVGTTPAAGPKVVIASGNINPGVVIASEQLKVMAWSGGVVPEGSFPDPDKLVGRVAKQLIYSGEPITEARLAAVDARGGLASTITPGKRAITVRVNDVIAVAGFTLPGSFVDVMVSAKDAAGAPFSRIVLTGVKVLAIAQETAADQKRPKVVNAVTLELTPLESEKLDLARSIGSLSLVLRNELDSSPVTSSGSRLSDLIVGTGEGGLRRGGVVAPGATSGSAVPGVQEIRGVRVGGAFGSNRGAVESPSQRPVNMEEGSMAQPPARPTAIEESAQ